MTHRTFIAFDIDDASRRRMAELQTRLGKGSKVPPLGQAWVQPANLHVTAVFLGDCEDAVLAEVCRLAGEVAARQPGAIEFDVRGVRVIPPRGPLRMFWADVADTTGRLGQLHADLQKALGPLGFPPENRSFHPHITLARIKYVSRQQAEAMRAVADSLAEEFFGRVRLEHLTVYTSRLTREGPVYSVAAKPTLGGG
ncbi:MAG: RNA 2',3'-cyclic phosphodiesterase [Phycisphaerae bacterium]|nr:RNA 2',3'-cyclic phosphodiesterase [Phycisphaerae bacterium]